MAITSPGAASPPWRSGWWRGRPYGSDDGHQIGYAVLEIDLLGQPIAQLYTWAPTDSQGNIGAWDHQIWLRYDSVEGVVDHVLRNGDQTIVVASTVPTADCAAVFVDAATHLRDEMPDTFLAACFTALAATAPDLALSPATAADAPSVADARATTSKGSLLPEAPWQAVDLVRYLEALVVAEAAGIAGDDITASD